MVILVAIASTSVIRDGAQAAQAAQAAPKAQDPLASAAGLMVRFRGVRGSYAVPGPDTLRFGGHTSCVEVRAGGHVIILDAGSGIISLGGELVKEYFAEPAETRGRLHCMVLLSHMHHDHIQGYPFFAPLYLRQALLHVYGPRMLREDLATVLNGAMVAPYFPVDAEDVAAERVIRNISDGMAVELQPTEVSRVPRVVPVDEVNTSPEHVVVRAYHGEAHPRGGVFMYRVEHHGRSVVYATDTEGYVGGDRGLIRFARGADVLIHDAQYRFEEYVAGKQGWGHSTAEMAVDVAQQAGVKQLVLFHHAPTSTDLMVAQMEREAQALLPDTIAAYEGLTLNL